MIITDIKFYVYNLPLTLPITLKGKQIYARKGLIVCATINNAVEGYGEIAPLDGFSRENFDDVCKQALQVKNYLINMELNDKFLSLENSFQIMLESADLFPSMRFGLESAFLNAIAIIKENSLYQILSDNYHHEIKVSGLLQGNQESILAEAEKLFNEGFRSFKLKVGRNFEEDCEIVQSLNKQLEGKALIHLDANQNWTAEQAIEFGQKIGCAAVEYIEEPFNNVEQIPHFFNDTLIPIALDESLLTVPLDEINHIEGVDFLILKPTLMGGIEHIWKYVRLANQMAFSAVMSSSFESGIGVYTLAQLAGASTHRERWSGLDTLKFFKEDLLREPLTINAGKINLDANLIHKDNIRFDLLKEL